MNAEPTLDGEDEHRLQLAELDAPGTAPGYADRLRDAKRAVIRAVRTGQLDDARRAMQTLRADLAIRGNRHTIETHLLAAMEAAGTREAYGRNLVTWLVQSARESHLLTPPVDSYELPTVLVEPGALPRMIANLESALQDGRFNVYWMGGRLVCLTTLEEKGVETTKLMDVSEQLLIELGTRAAKWCTKPEWQKEIRRKGGGTEWLTVAARYVDCPKEYARGLLAQRGRRTSVFTPPPGASIEQLTAALPGSGPPLPALTALLNAPTLRPDFSLLDLPGYDESTGYYLSFPAQGFPPIAATPSQTDAFDALDILDELLDGVQFADDVSRAVGLAALLTSVVRPSLPAAPMFAVTAPMRGTGKSYLLDIIALLSTGSAATSISAGSDDTELEKRLVSVLLSGAQLISIDNVSRPINSDLLNSLLTQERVTVRPLGGSTTVDVPCSPMVLINGNNLALAADTTRRVMQCSLDARAAEPELIVRDTDAHALLRSDRGRYVAAALTILRAYVAAGMPDKPAQLGSFGVWGDLVRGALVWLGERDPIDSMASVRAVDPHRTALTAVVEQWAAVLSDRRCTAAEVIHAAQHAGDFHDALVAVAGERGVISSNLLGKYLGRNAGFMIDDKRLQPGPKRNGIATWVLHGAVKTQDSAVLRLV